MEPNTDKITPASILNRVTSPTPDFWLKLRKLWGWLGGVRAGIIGLDHEIVTYLQMHLVPAIALTAAKIIALPAVTTWAHTFLAQKTKTPTNDTANQ